MILLFMMFVFLRYKDSKKKHFVPFFLEKLFLAC